MKDIYALHTSFNNEADITHCSHYLFLSTWAVMHTIPSFGEYLNFSNETEF